MIRQPLGWLGLLGVLGGVLNAFLGLRRNEESRALIGSGAFIAGLMIAGAVGVFPLMLRSTVAPEYSLSAYRTAADGHGLGVALVWWPIALVFAVGYFFFTYRHYSGKVKPAEDTQTPY
jgi:cytochrome d ubiquinol oxidase subunit II